MSQLRPYRPYMRPGANIRATHHVSMASQVLLTTAKPQPYFAARSGPVNIVALGTQDLSAFNGHGLGLPGQVLYRVQ